MKDIQFPIFKTKMSSSAGDFFAKGEQIKGAAKSFNLADPKERKAYFELKAGREIKQLRDYLKNNTFIAYLLGKKNSGKGTYSKMFSEIINPERISHISIGDIIREVHQDIISDPKKKKELIEWLKKNFRGFLSIEKTIGALLKRNTETLLPTEFILALVKREISKLPKKALFIDGFPRDLDQISYSLFFRDLIDYRQDPDIFVLIDVPEAVIDERIKWRRVCPKCQTSRNLKLLPSSKIGYGKKKKEFYLICDNPNCQERKMVSKEGDELGTKPIRERLKTDEKLMRKAFSLYGIPKILLRNSLPATGAKKYVDDYEITPEYCYEWNEKEKKARVKEKPWIIKDDERTPSYSLLAAPVVVSLIKQMTKVLGL